MKPVKLKATRVDVWAATIDDRPGGTAEKLETLSKAGANLEFLLARRAIDQPGKGVLFAAPLKGAKALKAAQAAGFERSPALNSVRVEGADAPGLCARMTRALAVGGISFRGLSAVAVGRRYISYLALDDAADAVRAVELIRKMA